MTTEYVSGMEYVNGALQSIYHEEGRYVKNGSNWHHEYVIRDHLGNNRVFFSDTNGNGVVSTSEVSQAVTLVEVPTEASGKHTTTPSVWPWKATG